MIYYVNATSSTLGDDSHKVLEVLETACELVSGKLVFNPNHCFPMIKDPVDFNALEDMLKSYHFMFVRR